MAAVAVRSLEAYRFCQGDDDMRRLLMVGDRSQQPP